MNSQNLFWVSRMILLAIAVSLVTMILLYAIQNPKIMLTLATVSWNGTIIY